MGLNQPDRSHLLEQAPGEAIHMSPPVPTKASNIRRWTETKGPRLKKQRRISCWEGSQSRGVVRFAAFSLALPPPGKGIKRSSAAGCERGAKCSRNIHPIMEDLDVTGLLALTHFWMRWIKASSPHAEEDLEVQTLPNRPFWRLLERWECAPGFDVSHQLISNPSRSSLFPLPSSLS